MKKAIPWAIVVLTLAFAAACASAPPKKPVTEAPDAELAQAKDLKQKADAYGLSDYAPDEYAAAVKDLQAGQDSYGKDNAASKQSLDSAIAGFTSVIDKGGPLYLGKLRERSDASKKAADDLKASVAVKDDYSKAKEVYDRAVKEAAAKDLENAKKDFELASGMFDTVAKQAQDKKDKALKAMQETDQGLTESEQKAADAERSLQDEGFATTGGSQ
jgi:hypothetical protein